MNVSKFLSGAAVLTVLSTTSAMAFTPRGDVMETDSSAITSTWQPSAADRGDTIAGACEGFAYNACVREFVVANRDLFPEQFTSESDFFLNQGTVYMVPTRDGIIEPATTSAPASSDGGLLDIVNGLSAEQERQAAVVNELAANFATLSVDDVDGLAARLRQISEQVAGFGPLRDSVQALEEAFVQIQNGQLTEAMITSIQTQIDQSLSSVQSDISSLEIRFDERLALIFGIPLLLILGVLVFTILNRRQTTKVAKAQKTTDDSITALTGRVTNLESGLNETREDLSDFKEDVSVMTVINPGDIAWDDDNLSLEELKQLTPEDGAVEWGFHYDGHRYSFKLWRSNETPAGQVQTDIVRNVDSQQLVDAMSVKRLKTRVPAAIADGRLTPRVHAVAAE